MRSPLATLWSVQRSPRQRRAAAFGAVLVGLGLGSVHWLGFLAGGAMVGVCWPSLRSAISAGFGFGVVAIAVFLAQFALVGTLDGALGMGALLAIAVVTPLVAGSLGAAVCGLLFASESE